MPFTDDPPPRSTKPYYNQFKSWADSLKSFVNTLESSIATVAGAVGNKLDGSSRGAVNGVASLGSDGRVPSSQLPSSVSGARVVYWSGTAWPARLSGTDPVEYISTKDAAAPRATSMVPGDFWLRHPDAT